MSQQLRQEQSLLLEKQQNKYEQKITSLELQFATLANEKTRYQLQYEHTSKDYMALQTEHQNLSAKCEMLQKEHQKIILSGQILKKENERLVQSYEKQSKDFELKQRSLFDLEVTLKANDNKISLLEAALFKAEEKVQALRHDYEFIAAEKASLVRQLSQLQGLSKKQVESI